MVTNGGRCRAMVDREAIFIAMGAIKSESERGAGVWGRLPLQCVHFFAPRWLRPAPQGGKIH